MLGVLLTFALVACNEPPQEISWFRDADGDGYGTAEDWVLAAEQPEGYVRRGTDCDDTDPDINPDALEYCDGVDEDCDGQVDEEAIDRTTWYIDLDADDFGVAGSEGELACIRPDDTTNGPNTDCDDADPDVHPDAPEVCNDVDDDCDGDIDDGLCHCWPTPLASESDAQWTGEANGSEAGAALAMGDFDGDGRIEAVLGAPEHDGGRVYLLDGQEGRVSLARAERTVTGIGGRFGAAVDSGGDVDGDGFVDLVVGAPTLGEVEDEEEPVPTGQLYLFRGPSGGTLSAAEAWALWPAQTGDEALGTAVLLADLDGDGAEDVVAASTTQVQVSTPTTLSGDLAEDIFVQVGLAGVTALARADLDGDGTTDLVAGLPGASEVYVLDGPLSGIIAAEDLYPLADEGALGTSLAVGDIDGDGRDDLAAGAPETTVAGGDRAGTVSIWLGGALVTEPHARLIGVFSDDGAGAGVAMGGDLDGDGIHDVVAVADNHEQGGRGAGAAWLVPGGASLSGIINLAEIDQGWSGLATDQLSHARSDADLDGDGLFDLVLAAPGNDLGFTNSGGAYVVLGCR